MNRYRVISILSATVLMTATAYAQVSTPFGVTPVSLTAQRGQRSGGPAPSAAGAPAAWWTDTALMTRLGLSDVQKARIENIFQTHRANLTVSKAVLEAEEAQLSKLLAADTIDRPSVSTQINKVIQARAEMERVNATMTLEMREQLTPAQWTQLQTGQTGGRGLGGGGRGGRGGGLGAGGAGGRGTPFGAAATYSAEKSITLEGRVVAFNLANPRSSVVIEVVGGDGRTTRWTGELAALTDLEQQGWTRSSLSVGEKVSLEGAPSLDSSANALLVRSVRKIPETR